MEQLHAYYLLDSIELLLCYVILPRISTEIIFCTIIISRSGKFYNGMRHITYRGLLRTSEHKIFGL
jgi:hypothetical protein